MPETVEDKMFLDQKYPVGKLKSMQDEIKHCVRENAKNKFHLGHFPDSSDEEPTPLLRNDLERFLPAQEELKDNRSMGSSNFNDDYGYDDEVDSSNFGGTPPAARTDKERAEGLQDKEFVAQNGKFRF